MTRVAMLIVLAFFLPSAGEAQDPQSLKDGVVKVRAGSKTGSGVVLEVQEKTAFVLTAYHVIEGQSDIQISFLREPHRPLAAKVVQNQGDQEEHGLSILQVEVDDLRGLLPLTLSQQVEPSLREPVFAIGFYGAGNVPWSLTEGKIIDARSGSVLFTGAIEEGNSGGPLIQNGEVIGVVAQKGTAHNIAVPARLAEYFAEGVIGILPVRCNAVLIPEKSCGQYHAIDRRSCDHIKRGNALFESGEYERAVAEYEQAIASREYAVFYNNRGAIKTTMRNFSGAAEDFRKALQLDPDYTVAEVNQTLLGYYGFFFQWAEEGEAPEDYIRKFLTTQKERPSSNGGNTFGLDGVFGRLLGTFADLGQVYHDYLQFEDRIESFDQGDFDCYGGDIIAANNELSRTLAGQLAAYLRGGGA